MKIILFLSFLMFSFRVIAFEKRISNLKKVRSVDANLLIADTLVKNELYFSSISFLKEYILESKNINSKRVDNLMAILANKVGIRHFEILPVHMLEKINADYARYVLGKKYFRKGNYRKAYNELVVVKNSFLRPFSTMLMASSLSLMGKSVAAKKMFLQCQKFKIDEDELTTEQLRQREMNRDSCIVGRARVLFEEGKFDQAKQVYLDLEKKSPLWPEILFEEAWNSFYLKNYNRTLGKLVTYKAPLFDHIFNTEIDILNALSFLELCLYKDAQVTANNFFKKYDGKHKVLERLIRSKKSFHDYYRMAMIVMKNKKLKSSVVQNVFKSVVWDPTFGELYAGVLYAHNEIQKIKKIKRYDVRKMLAASLKNSISTHEEIMGAYVRYAVKSKTRKLKKDLDSMSYIKLETFSRLKMNLYRPVSSAGKRGDIKYLRRTDKQYFWDFNGEFWADELGDYVFALGSECHQ